MSFEIGKKCEGLHEGRWYVCTVLASEKDGYSITFDGWSRKFDTVLAPEFVRPRSTIDSRKRKPWTPSINFNKLLPDDEISIDVEGSRKQALVRVVNQVCLSYLTPLISIHVIIVVKLNSTYRDSKSRHVLTTFVMRFSATLVKPWSMHIRILSPVRAGRRDFGRGRSNGRFRSVLRPVEGSTLPLSNAVHFIQRFHLSSERGLDQQWHPRTLNLPKKHLVAYVLAVFNPFI